MSQARVELMWVTVPLLWSLYMGTSLNQRLKSYEDATNLRLREVEIQIHRIHQKQNDLRIDTGDFSNNNHHHDPEKRQ